MLYTSHQHDYSLTPSVSPECPRELSWAVVSFPSPSLGRSPPCAVLCYAVLCILEPFSSFCLKEMHIAGTAGLSSQRSLWEVRKKMFVLGLCGEVIESEN